MEGWKDIGSEGGAEGSDIGAIDCWGRIGEDVPLTQLIQRYGRWMATRKEDRVKALGNDS